MNLRNLQTFCALFVIICCSLYIGYLLGAAS